MNRLNTISMYALLWFVLILQCSTRAFASTGPDTSSCGLKAAFSEPDQVGGIYIPSETPNSFFRILVIFAEFKDDTSYQVGDWPVDKPPNYMNTFVDSTVTENSTVGNITQYFREMSLGKMTVIGKSYFVIAAETRAWYSSINYDRAQINQTVIQGLNDSISLAPYDNWTGTSDYNFQNSPDGQIDMICVIWRNIWQDAAFNSFSFDYDFNFNGEASLGSDAANVWFPVDGAARTVYEGYPAFGVPGSGLTIAKGYDGQGAVQQFTIHELGHYLLGDNHFHTAGGTWAIMANYMSRSNCANSFERTRLGWITPMEYSSNTTVNLRDYVTTGDALRIALPNTNPQEYFLLENHQRLSVFDKPDDNYPEKGLYVLHQFGSTPNPPGGTGLGFSPTLVSADGKYAWTFDHYTPWVNGVIVPVFKKGAASPVSGFFDSDLIQYTDPQSGQAKSGFIFAYVDPVTGQVNDTELAVGDGEDAFSPGYQTVFSPWSNPRALDSYGNTSNIAFDEISDANGVVQVQLYVAPNTQDQAPASRPQNLSAAFSASNGQ
jgi:M6 family metalloprotease-like protein